jgi:hypothetical protein
MKKFIEFIKAIFGKQPDTKPDAPVGKCPFGYGGDETPNHHKDDQ